MPRKRVPVTMRALVQRINRRLRKEEEMLRKARGTRWWRDLGEWYIVNFNRNTIVAGHVDPKELGRELGVLRNWETVASEEG